MPRSQITFSRGPAVAGEFGVHFPLDIDGRQLGAVISRDALRFLDPCGPDRPSSLECFAKHQDRIQAAATAKCEAGEIERDGMVWLRGDDWI